MTRAAAHFATGVARRAMRRTAVGPVRTARISRDASRELLGPVTQTRPSSLPVQRTRGRSFSSAATSPRAPRGRVSLQRGLFGKLTNCRLGLRGKVEPTAVPGRCDVGHRGEAVRGANTWFWFSAAFSFPESDRTEASSLGESNNVSNGQERCCERDRIRDCAGGIRREARWPANSDCRG